MSSSKEIINNVSNINNNSSNLANFDLNINIISLSYSETLAKQIGEQISNQKSEIGGFYQNIFDRNRVSVYPRWPNCSKTLPNAAVSDAIIIDVENIEDLNVILEYIKSKERVHLLIFWTNDNEAADEIKKKASEFKNGKVLFKNEIKIEELRELIIKETKTFNQTIRNIFETIDSNKNGFLEKKEVLAFARERGDNVSSQEFVDTLNLIDRHGLGKICFEDFEKWWKMGGHTSSIFGRLVRLSEVSRDMMIADDKLQLLKSDLIGIKFEKNDLSSHLIKFFSNIKFDIAGFQFFGNFLIGGLEKDQALSLYLQRFSEEFLNQNKNKTWFQIVLSVEPNEAKKVVNLIRFLKTSILELLERSNRSAVSFIRSFFNIEESIIENQVLLTFKLKRDLQDFFENAVLPILQFFDLFSCSKDSTSQLLIDFQTKLKISEIFDANLSIKDAFKAYSLEIKANMLRGHLRKIISTYKLDSELSNLFWAITSPNTVDLNCIMDIENLISEKNGNTKLGFLGEIMEYYTNQYESIFPFIRKITNVEFALSFNKLFIDLRTKLR